MTSEAEASELVASRAETAAGYAAAVAYWDGQEASYNGVLGGYEHVSEADIVESEAFLKRSLARTLAGGAAASRPFVAVDCGAGVGRVTAQLLVRYFDVIDLVEPSRHLLSAADKVLRQSQKIGQSFCIGLQDFQPKPSRYDAVWIQWALLYLTDGDIVAVLERLSASLKTNGVIFVKENICSQQQHSVQDKEDSSVTRSHQYLLDLIARAGLQLLYSAQQRKFPRELYRVQMYALRPKAGNPACAPEDQNVPLSFSGEMALKQQSA